MQRLLAGEHCPTVMYFGVLKKEQRDVITQIEAEVFKHWDNLSTSPPKSRPRTEQEREVTGLKVLTCDRSGRFGFPEHVMNKFPTGSEHHQALDRIKKDFEEEFPQHSGGGDTSNPPGSGSQRIVGRPDYTIEWRCAPQCGPTCAAGG